VSDELSELKRRLEAATAPDCPPHLLGDAETAAWREGWLALGELLEAGQPTRHAPVPLWQPPRRPARAVWRRAAAAAVAATLLLSVTLLWQAHRGNRRSGMPSPPQPLAAGLEPSTAPSAEPHTTSTEDELVWDDPLDEQIALAGQQILRLQQDGDYLGDAFGPLYYGLEEMGDELDQNTL
jgi:hypothetical protein